VLDPEAVRAVVPAVAQAHGQVVAQALDPEAAQVLDRVAAGQVLGQAVAADLAPATGPAAQIESAIARSHRVREAAAMPLAAAEAAVTAVGPLGRAAAAADGAWAAAA